MSPVAVPASVPARPQVLVGRQAIFDRNLTLVGYELLYRAHAGDGRARGADAVTMSATTIVSAMLGIGLDDLVGNAVAWVNVSGELLETDAWSILDRTRTVIEILESVRPTRDSVAALRRLVAAGYVVALDDFVCHPEFEPFLDLVHIVKLEVRGLGYEDLLARSAPLRARGIKLVAEKVETEADFELARELGFDFFQGWHFCEAEVVARRDLPAQFPAIAAALTRVTDLDATDRDVERAFQVDPPLMMKLLQIANSAAFGVAPVESPLQAVRLVGRETLYRWLAIMLVTSAPRRSALDEERLRISLERARLCELVARRGARPGDPSTFFLAGLLSHADLLLGVPMRAVLDGVRANSAVRSALLDRAGPIAPAIDLAVALERGDFRGASTRAGEAGVGDDLGSMLSDAMTWARDVRAALGPQPAARTSADLAGH